MVRGMKQASLANLRRTFCVWLMTAAATVGQAQTPSPAFNTGAGIDRRAGIDR